MSTSYVCPIDQAELVAVGFTPEQWQAGVQPLYEWHCPKCKREYRGAFLQETQGPLPFREQGLRQGEGSDDAD